MAIEILTLCPTSSAGPRRVAGLAVSEPTRGTFNYYVDKKRWWVRQVVQKKSLFLSTTRVKNVHVEVGGGQKREKLCPRSH